MSIENDSNWYDRIKEEVQAPSEIVLMDLESEYSRPNVDFSVLDVVVIDGRNRNECCEYVVKNIREGNYKKGLAVVFDDADRLRYEQAIEKLVSLSDRNTVFNAVSGYPLSKVTRIFLF